LGAGQRTPCAKQTAMSTITPKKKKKLRDMKNNFIRLYVIVFTIKLHFIRVLREGRISFAFIEHEKLAFRPFKKCETSKTDPCKTVTI
jgi:hypothetical protein